MSDMGQYITSWVGLQTTGNKAWHNIMFITWRKTCRHPTVVCLISLQYQFVFGFFIEKRDSECVPLKNFIKLQIALIPFSAGSRNKWPCSTQKLVEQLRNILSVSVLNWLESRPLDHLFWRLLVPPIAEEVVHVLLARYLMNNGLAVSTNKLTREANTSKCQPAW